MAGLEFDPRWWNLPVAATAMALGCGPLVPIADDDDTGTDTDPPPTGGQECNSDDDCPSGYCDPTGTCRNADGYYEGDGYYDDGYYPPDTGYYDDDGYYCDEYCCDDDCYNECYDQGDCPVDQHCVTNVVDGNVCEPIPAIEDCNSSGLIGTPLDAGPLGGIVSLTFVEVDGDGAEDLAIDRGTSLELLRGPGIMPTQVVYTTEVFDTLSSVTSGDFNTDGNRDLAVGHLASSLVAKLSGDGAGAFTPGELLDTIGIPVRLHGLAWDAAPHNAVAILGEKGWVHIDLGDPDAELVAFPHIGALDLETFDMNFDDLDDLIVAVDGGAAVHLGNSRAAPGDALWVGDERGVQRPLVAGRFQPGTSAVVLHELVNDEAGAWIRLDGHGLEQDYTPQLLLAAGTMAATGDVDGDVIEDFVVVDGAIATVAFGGGEDDRLFRCSSSFELPLAATTLAVGDLDGDDTDDIAISDSESLMLLSIE